VLQADGGTRTAAICAAYVALVDALKKLPAQLPPSDRRDANLATYDPKGALVDQLAAVSVGLVDGELLLDLDYKDDARASVDMNIAYTKADKLVEVQGSAENGGGFDRGKMLEMIDLAIKGCREIMAAQQAALGQK
jgi:ribonuclease PH